MTSIIRADNISTVAGTGTIAVQAGNQIVQPGMVLQVIQSSNSSQVEITGGVFTDIGLSASITPSSASNKILVMYSQQANARNAENVGGGVRLLRGDAVIHNPPIDSTGPFQYYAQDANDVHHTVNVQVLDSPNTTSEITYKLQGRPYATSTMIARFNNAAVTASPTSTLTLMEIAG